MKNKMRYLFLLSVCLGLASCADDLVSDVTSVDKTAGTESYIKYITATIEPFGEIYDQASTRGDFVIANGTFKDLWAEGDTIGIFPSQGGQVEFPLTEYGTISANFDGGGWALKPSYTYSAYFPFSKWNVFNDNKTIPIEYDYSKMKQTANGSTAHLGAYDYMGSSPTTKSDSGGLNFTMKRMSSVLWFDLTIPCADTFTELSLTSNSTKSPFITRANLDISGSEPAVNSLTTTQTISMKLNNIAVAANGKLTAYMLVLPVNLKTNGGTLTLTLTGNNFVYTTTFTPEKDLVRNDGWKISKTMDLSINSTLVANAEANNTVTFIKNADGKYWLSENKNKIKSVFKLNLTNVTESEVYDQLKIFTSLMYLYCSDNQLTSLDVSKNVALRELDCSNNKLTSLSTANNTVLQELNCSNNQISSLSLYNNTALTDLNCSNNQISSLSITKSTALTNLNCSGNKLTSLSTTYNTALTTLNCSNNQISSLGLTKNTALGVLNCSGNKLTKLTLNYNTELIYINCSDNQLTTFNGLNNTKVQYLYAGENQFTTLNWATTGSTAYLPYLTVLDLSNCTSLTSLIFNIYSDDSQVGKMSILNVTGCTELTVLRVDGHKLTSLNTSTNTELGSLTCSDNLLTTTGLSLTNNTALKTLNCSGNLMTGVIVTQLTQLTKSNIICGNQYTNEAKTTSRTMTLYARKADTTSLNTSLEGNKNVNVVNQ